MNIVIYIMLFVNCFVLGRLVSTDFSADDIHNICRDVIVVTILNVIVFFAVHLVFLQ